MKVAPASNAATGAKRSFLLKAVGRCGGPVRISRSPTGFINSLGIEFRDAGFTFPCRLFRAPGDYDAGISPRRGSYSSSVLKFASAPANRLAVGNCPFTLISDKFATTDCAGPGSRSATFYPTSPINRTGAGFVAARKGAAATYLCNGLTRGHPIGLIGGII